ncbi:MAG: hypothetical protein QOI34_1162, partial [Verrucomicrobiota bacterium]
ANQLSDGKSAVVLRTLAASYAETGRFTEALATAQRASGLAHDPSLAAALKEEIKLYQNGPTNSAH